MDSQLSILALFAKRLHHRSLSMLAIWGLITILGMIVAIASRHVSPLVALFLFPVTACLLPAFGLKTAQFALSGLILIAPVVAMFLFAILFFGVLTDAGTIEPFVRILLRGIRKDPVSSFPAPLCLRCCYTSTAPAQSSFLLRFPPCCRCIKNSGWIEGSWHARYRWRQASTFCHGRDPPFVLPARSTPLP